MSLSKEKPRKEEFFIEMGLMYGIVGVYLKRKLNNWEADGTVDLVCIIKQSAAITILFVSDIVYGMPMESTN